MAVKRKNKKPKDQPKTRKQIRKDQRKAKKVRKNDYYTNRNKTVLPPLEKEAPPKREPKNKNIPRTQETPIAQKQNTDQNPSVEKTRQKEKREQIKLQNEMDQQRKKQLLEANIEEDRSIKKLEKQLKLNKRKSKAVPKSFSIDGLDYLLEVCDPENMKSSSLAEQQMTEVNEGFEEDFNLMMGDSEEEDISDEGNSDNDVEMLSEEEEEEDISEPSEEESNEEMEASEASDDELMAEEESKPIEKELSDIEEDSENPKTDATWEDIYGRTRNQDGTVVNKTEGKYIPPAVRARLESGNSDDQQRAQKLIRLKRQLKGLFNRLAESNMHNIATQIEELYMSNSRHDMNDTITSLVLNAVVSNVLAPERLLMEHIMLITVLHANVGTEVGAHFLQTVVKQFDELINVPDQKTENKTVDNLVQIISQLYNFKVFDAKLMYEILNKLSTKFGEKDVECILHVLKSVGFTLRKDNPIELKNLIVILQKHASKTTQSHKDNPRIKFMLDTLLAIKNNNMNKIPNYDTTYSEHLKKIMRGFIRKGNYVTQLNVSLDDLLKADERGRWWVVGSAWVGNEAAEKSDTPKNSNSFSQKLLELARKQRMNTDTRKNIFCIIMSSEDYLDAFEKLLRLGLKNQQERDTIHVILHCCLQEKKYNPFYAVLAQKFCDHDRKYQMTIKYSIWDKLKTLKEHSATQISNLAKMLSYLFVEKGLPISTLKVVEFGDLDKITLRFMRQTLLGVLLHEDEEVFKEVFEKVAQSDKLKTFRDSLRLFIHHFLLRNLQSQGVPEDKKELLQQRSKIVERILTRKSNVF